jgi:hypothetical protein
MALPQAALVLSLDGFGMDGKITNLDWRRNISELIYLGLSGALLVHKASNRVLEYPYKTASKMLIFCQILTIQSFRWS